MVTYALAAPGEEIFVTTPPQLEGLRVERCIGVVYGAARLEARAHNL